MSELTHPQALFLGLLQGLTEFLPISSSGHLALAQDMLNLRPDAPPLLLLDVVTHLATLAAVAVVFAPTFRSYLRRLRRESERSFAGARIAWRLAGLAVLASIPTAAIGLLLKGTIQSAFGSTRAIAAGLILTGALLLTSGLGSRPRLGWKRFPWWGAVLVGVAQGIAIFPGVSRSGSTICVAMFLGLKRRWAGEFSFFIAVPAIVGASLLHGLELLSQAVPVSPGLRAGPFALAAFAAFASGALALLMLLSVVRRGRLQWFGCYTWLLALAVLVFA